MATHRLTLLLVLGLHCPSIAFSTSAGARILRGIEVNARTYPNTWSTQIFVRGGNQEVPLVERVTTKDPSEVSPLKSITLPMATILSSFGNAYATSLQTRPILTKSSTAGVIFALSDLLAQRLESKGRSKTEPINMTRMMASSIVGFCYFGPAAHYWYQMIFALLPGTSLMSTLQKATLGQLIFGPTFTCIFFASALLQSGNFSLHTWFRKIKSDLPGAWAAGLGFWPLVDLVSYSMVSPEWIPLFINVCSLLWTIYLSGVANKSRK